MGRKAAAQAASGTAAKGSKPGGSAAAASAARSGKADAGSGGGFGWGTVAVGAAAVLAIGLALAARSSAEAGNAAGVAGSPTSASGVAAAAGSPPPPAPSDLRKNYECALRCSRMTKGDLATIDATLRQAGCVPENPGAHVLCSTTPEQVCVGSCGSGQQDMSKWLPGAFGPTSSVTSEELDRYREIHVRYWACAEQCSREGVSVDVRSEGAQARAVATLRRCGVVQLKGSYDLEMLDRLQRGIDELHADKKKYAKYADHKQLHTARYQVYLPFAEPFNSRAAIGVNDFVHGVLEEYFGKPWGIDHVSILTSESPCTNQSLHPDVHYFMGRTVSVHTALIDITREMGPTHFCPCTGELESKEDWPASAAVKMSNLLKKACVGPTFAPAFTPRGTTTVYDSAMFHQGLENLSGRDRPVLKLEVGAKGFPEIRNYIQSAPAAGKKETKKWRAALGPPRMGDAPTGVSS